jgi:hypothetical protein
MKTNKTSINEKRGDGEFELYNYDFNEVKKHCDSLESDEQKLIYLEYAKKEKLNKDDGLDLELYFNGPKFTEKVENEIKFIKSKMKIKEAQKFENEKGDSAAELIWWKGTEGQLIYLYEELVKKNLIDSSQDDRKYVLLSKHFKNKKGEQFTNKQMSQAAQNLVANKTRKPKDADIIDNITNKTTKQE